MTLKTIRNNSLLFNQTQPPTEEILTVIEKAKVVLVVSHIDPDGDALGTQLAMAAYLKSLGKEVILCHDNGIPEKYKFLKGVNDIPQTSSLDDSLKVDTAIVLECPSIDRIGESVRFMSESTTIVNIDHHRDNDSYGNLNWFNIDASSVGEMIYEFFETVDFKISPDVAEQLYVAIMTDTGRFRYRSTSERTMAISGKLITAGADPQKTCEFVYYDMKPSTMRLTGKVLNGIEYYDNGLICVLSMTAPMLAESEAEYSESDGLVDFTLFGKGVQAGAFIKEMEDDKVKVSLRSRDGINVAEVAARFGGGGHFNAAGCTFTDTISNVKTIIIDALRDANRKKV